MSDLVQRLRERHSFLCDEAADELDRLNAQALELCAEISGLRREREDFHMDYRMKCDEETKRLHVDNERLRGLLRDINACQRHFDVGAWQVRLYQDHYDRINAAIAGAAVQPNGATDKGRQ